MNITKIIIQVYKRHCISYIKCVLVSHQNIETDLS